MMTYVGALTLKKRQSCGFLFTRGAIIDFANSLAALVVEWGRRHCVAPASSAAGFVNAGTPAWTRTQQSNPTIKNKDIIAGERS